MTSTQDEQLREADMRARFVRLDECPVGLFWGGGVLCNKTEYRTAKGAIEAHIVCTGEFFWGDRPQTVESQCASLVVPIDIEFAENALEATLVEQRQRTSRTSQDAQIEMLGNMPDQVFISIAESLDVATCRHRVAALIASLPAPDATTEPAIRGDEMARVQRAIENMEYGNGMIVFNEETCDARPMTLREFSKELPRLVTPTNCFPPSPAPPLQLSGVGWNEQANVQHRSP